jgi:hypothetical protein
LYNPINVVSGNKRLVRPSIDNFVLWRCNTQDAADRQSAIETEYSAIAQIKNGGPIVYSFYCQEDDKM